MDEKRRPRHVAIDADETSRSSDAPGDAAPPPQDTGSGGIFAALRERLRRALATDDKETS